MATHVGKMLSMFIVACAIINQIASAENLFEPEIATRLMYRDGAYAEIVGRGPAYLSYYLRTVNLIRVDCQLPENVTFAVCLKKDLAFDLYDEVTKTILETKICTKDTSYNLKRERYSGSEYQFYMPFNVRIDDQRLFGRLRCRYRQNDKIIWSNNSITFPFVICTTDSQACQDNSPCDNDMNNQKYCVVTKSGPKPCTAISDRNWCDFEHSRARYCPVDEIGSCNAAVKNSSVAFFAVSAYDDCPSGTMNRSPLSYKGRPLLYKEPFHVSLPEAALRFECSRGSPFYNATVEIEIYFATEKKAKATCVDEINFNLSLIDPDLFTKGALTGLLSLNVETAKGKTLGEFKNDIITFGTELDLSNQSGGLKCKFTGWLAHDFRITRWWTKESTGTRRLSEQRFGRNENTTERKEPWTMSNDDVTHQKNDVYQCHVLIEYKSCAPHRLFQREISSKKIQHYYN